MIRAIRVIRVIRFFTRGEGVVALVDPHAYPHEHHDHEEHEEEHASVARFAGEGGEKGAVGIAITTITGIIGTNARAIATEGGVVEGGRGGDASSMRSEHAGVFCVLGKRVVL